MILIGRTISTGPVATHYDEQVTGFGNITVATTGDETGKGHFILSQNNSGYGGWDGWLRVNSGMAVITANGALGNPYSMGDDYGYEVGTRVYQGGTLALRAPEGSPGITYTYNEPLYLQGYGHTRFWNHLTGALYNDGGNNTWQGSVTLYGYSMTGFGAIGGSALTLSGKVSGFGSFVKLGSGTVVLSNSSNDWVGFTIIRGGALRITTPSAIPGGIAWQNNVGNPLILEGGVLEIGTDTTFTRYAGGTGTSVTWAGSGGFSAYGGTRTVSFGLGSTLGLQQLYWGGNFVPSEKALLFGSTTSNALIRLTNPINLGSLTREVRVRSGATNASYAELSGQLTGSGFLRKTGAGKLHLNNNSNDFGTFPIVGNDPRNNRIILQEGTLLLDNHDNYNICFDAISEHTPTLGLLKDFTLNDGKIGTLRGQIEFSNVTGLSGVGFAAYGAERTLKLWVDPIIRTIAIDNLTLGAYDSDNTIYLKTYVSNSFKTLTVIQGLDPNIPTAKVDNIKHIDLLTGNGRLDAQGNISVDKISGATLRLSSSAAISGSIDIKRGGELSLKGSASIDNDEWIYLNSGTLTLAGDAEEYLDGIYVGGENGSALDLSFGRIDLGTSGGLSMTYLSAFGILDIWNMGDYLDYWGADGYFDVRRYPEGTAYWFQNDYGDNQAFYGSIVADGDFVFYDYNYNGYDYYNYDYGWGRFLPIGNNYTDYFGYDVDYYYGDSDYWDWQTVANPISPQVISQNRELMALRLDGVQAITINPKRTLKIHSGAILSVWDINAIFGDGTLNLNAWYTSLHIQADLGIQAKIEFANQSIMAGGATLVLTGNSSNTHDNNSLQRPRFTLAEGTLILNKDNAALAINADVEMDPATRLELYRSQQIGSDKILTFQSGYGRDRAPALVFNGENREGVTQTLSDIKIDYDGGPGAGIIDFKGGTVANPNWLILTDFSLIDSASVELIIKSWVEFEDFFLIRRVGAWASEFLHTSILFEGYGHGARGRYYDANYWEIVPMGFAGVESEWDYHGGRLLPEPSTYGAIFGLVGLGLVAWRRRQQRQ